MTSLMLPNHFHGRTKNALLQIPNSWREVIDARRMKLLPWVQRSLKDGPVIVSLNETRCVMSNAKVIRFHECMIKVPIECKAGKGVYPLATFVDDEISLVRGYLMGFSKKIVDAVSFDTLQSFVFEDIMTVHLQNDIFNRRLTESVMELRDKINDVLSPGFILGREIDLGDGVYARGYWKLPTVNHVIHQERWLNVENSIVRINSTDYPVSALKETEDSFTIESLDLASYQDAVS